LKANQDNIEALTIFFSQPYRWRELSFDLIRQVLDKLKADKPKLSPLYVWHAYQKLDDYKGAQPVQELTALVALIRRVCGMDETLSDFDAVVRRNFRNGIMKHHSGGSEKFNEQQMDWLRMIRDHVATSFHVDLECPRSTGRVDWVKWINCSARRWNRCWMNSTRCWWHEDM